MSKISAYTALTAAQADDVALVVDVHDTSMAVTGTDKKITLANLAIGAGARTAFTVPAPTGNRRVSD